MGYTAAVLVALTLTVFQTVTAKNEELMQLFLDAVPKHPLFRTPEVYAPDPAQSKYTQNQPFVGAFQALSECSENRTGLKIGEFGSVFTPNYPRNYPARLACEWRLESLPGTKIQVVFFDIVTQPWFFAYFDYLMVTKNGNFDTVDRMSGDMNGKTPMVMTSDENVFGIRFRSSSLFNFRGFKLQYLVLPADENLAAIEPPVFDGFCGQPAYLPSTTAKPEIVVTTGAVTPMPESTTEPAIAAVGSNKPPFPIVMPPQAADATEDGKRQLKPEFDFNIVGGSEALKYAYPWMVALLIDRKHFCGGSLISNQYVVTAAHCTDKANEVTILLGTHNIKANKTVEDGRQIFNITRSHIFQHPEYNGNTITHDISILRLPEPVVFTDRIKPVCLPNRYSIARFFDDEQVKVTGWGKNADNAAGVNPYLKEAEVKVMPNGPCRNFFRGIITGNQICVETKTTSSPCKGDSGGPLMVERKGALGSYQMLVGIVSFGSLTCERGMPVGFTRITSFLDYINQVTGSNL